MCWWKHLMQENTHENKMWCELSVRLVSYDPQPIFCWNLRLGWWQVVKKTTDASFKVMSIMYWCKQNTHDKKCGEVSSRLMRHKMWPTTNFQLKSATRMPDRCVISLTLTLPRNWLWVIGWPKINFQLKSATRMPGGKKENDAITCCLFERFSWPDHARIFQMFGGYLCLVFTLTQGFLCWWKIIYSLRRLVLLKVLEQLVGG